MLTAHTATLEVEGSDRTHIAEATANMRKNMKKIKLFSQHSIAIKDDLVRHPQVLTEKKAHKSRKLWVVRFCLYRAFNVIPQVHGFFRIPVPLTSFLVRSRGPQNAS